MRPAVPGRTRACLGAAGQHEASGPHQLSICTPGVTLRGGLQAGTGEVRATAVPEVAQWSVSRRRPSVLSPGQLGMLAAECWVCFSCWRQLRSGPGWEPSPVFSATGRGHCFLMGLCGSAESISF